MHGALRTCTEVGRFGLASHWFASSEPGGRGGIPGAALSGAKGPSRAGPVSWAGPRLLWHGCGLPLARDSLAGGEGGLPGSRDEDAWVPLL